VAEGPEQVNRILLTAQKGQPASQASIRCSSIGTIRTYGHGSSGGNRHGTCRALPLVRTQFFLINEQRPVTEFAVV
jgi:hypothetical protein